MNSDIIPLSFAIEGINREQAYGIANILKPLIGKICNTKIRMVEFNEGEMYIFNPINEFGNSVTINSDYFESIYSRVDLNKLVGYTLLTENPLARYILSNLTNFTNVKYIEGICIIPLEDKNNTLNFDLSLNSLILKGYFTYSFSPFDTDDYEYVKQLCKMFEIQILDSQDFSKWILQTNIDFTISPALWIRNNLHLIKIGDFPIFTIPFISTYDNDYDRRYGNIYNKFIINYFALLAFAKLADEYPILKSYIYNLRINDDNSISISLPNYSLVLKFKKLFYELYNSKTKYTIEISENLDDAVYKRYIIQEVDNDAYPIAFQSGDKYIVIHRSPLAMIYPSPFDFDFNNNKYKIDELESKMRNFYKKCHDNLEPVSLENINNMPLSELLRLIPITENKITYCFSSDTVKQIENNPLTRTPLSKETIERLTRLEYGLRGFFDVGVLYGLFSTDKNSSKSYEDFGVTKVVRIPVEKEHRELYGNLFLVKVLFADGTESDLFEISLPTINLEKIDELKLYVDKLWIKGFFLNNWHNSLIQFLKEKSFYISITDPILIQAKDSIYDGEKALSYMKNLL